MVPAWMYEQIKLNKSWCPLLIATSAVMNQRLDDWCGMATAANITGLNKFVKTLQAHRVGICAYAGHPRRLPDAV